MKGLGPCAPEGFSVPAAWHVCGTWVQSPNISSSGVLWHLRVQEGHGALGTGRVVWLLFLHPQLRSYPCTEGCWHALVEGDPPAMVLQGAQKSAPLRGRRSREMSPRPCSQPLPSSCPPTGQQKQLSTHSVLKRDDSGLDLATWGKKKLS